MIFSSVYPPDFKNWAKQYPDKIGNLILRFVFAAMWLSMGLAKIIYRSDDMYKDHDEFLGQLNYMKVTHPNSFVVSILEDFLIPNVEIIVIIVIMTEISIGLSLGLGLFTRLGSIVGGLMTINLWILTYGWDEWFWTYPLIFFPHVLFFLTRSGRDFGIDRIISESIDSKIINIII